MGYTNGTRRSRAALVGFVGSLISAGIAAMPASEALGQVVQLTPAAQNDPALFKNGVNGANALTPVSLYTAPTGFGVAFLLPITQLPLGGTNTAPINFNNKISAAQGAYTAAAPWAFPPAGANLANNSLQVTSYAVQAISGTAAADSGRVGISISGPEGGPTVAGFAVKLNNAPPPAATVHWLQVLADNNAITFPGGVPTANPGTTENIIDNGPATTATPYYDTTGAADTGNFFDAPLRSGLPSITANNYWIADLYVASGPAGVAPGAVTVYNGLSYGWANIFINAPTIPAFINSINSVFLNVNNLDAAFGVPGLLDSDYDGNTTDLDLSSIDTDINNDVYELPEPSSLVVLLGVGVAMLSRRRRGNAALAGIGS